MSRIANYHATNRNIYTDNLSFLSHCFKSCIKNLNESMLDGYEQDCSKFCVEKHIEAGVLLGNMRTKLSMNQRIGFHILQKRTDQEKQEENKFSERDIVKDEE